MMRMTIGDSPSPAVPKSISSIILIFVIVVILGIRRQKSFVLRMVGQGSLQTVRCLQHQQKIPTRVQDVPEIRAQTQECEGLSLDREEGSFEGDELTKADVTLEDECEGQTRQTPDHEDVQELEKGRN